MRIMSVKDLDSGQTWNSIVEDGEQDYETLAEFLGESKIANYSVTFEDYVPSRSAVSLNQKLAAVEIRARELTEELAARNKELVHREEELASQTGELNLIVAKEVEHRDKLRELETRNDLLEGENRTLKERDQKVVYPVPMPPKTPLRTSS